MDIKILEDTYFQVNEFDDDDKLFKLKMKINRLSNDERNLLLLYTHLGSYRKVGKHLGITYTLIFAKIKDIKNKLKYDN